MDGVQGVVEKSACPNCGSAASHGGGGGLSCYACGCYWASCPTCSSCVGYMREDNVDNSPCEHVAVWWAEDGPYWEDQALEKEYRCYLEQYERDLEMDEDFEAQEDPLLEFLKRKGAVETRTYTDGGKHGVSATFVFKGGNR